MAKLLKLGFIGDVRFKKKTFKLNGKLSQYVNRTVSLTFMRLRRPNLL